MAWNSSVFVADRVEFDAVSNELAQTPGLFKSTSQGYRFGVAERC